MDNIAMSEPDQDDGVESSPRSSIAELLPGMSADSLEDGVTPEFAFLLIRSRDAEGDPVWAFRATSTVNLEELLGVLVVQTELLRRKLVDFWED
jgi:hypothetical protein